MSDRRTNAGRAVREHALRVLYSSEMAGLSPLDALARHEASHVVPHVEPAPSERTRWFRIERMDDELPSPEQWDPVRDDVTALLRELESRREDAEACLRQASPRWRLDRMPTIDRCLLLIGVTEMLRSEAPRLRPVFHDLIELAKCYGGESTPRFVNGILDQARRNRGLPFR